MKRILATLLVLVMAAALSACGGTADPSTSAPNQPGAVISDTPKADDGLLDMEVSLPASFFESTTEDDIKAAVQENGYSSYTLHDDGSVTYKMTKAKYDETMKACKSSLDETIAGYLDGDEKVASFKRIEYNDDLSQIDIYADKALYSIWDGMYVLPFYISGAYYQAFAGVPADDIDVVVNIIDDSTKESLNTSSYREYINNMNSSAENTGGSAEVDAKNIPAVALQENTAIDNVCEFYVDYTKITNDVLPPSPGSWYSHYEAEVGKTYIDVCISYKNLSTRDISADDAMTASLLYGGKYQYMGFSMIEKSNRSDFTYSNITSIAPLSTEYLHYLFEVPEEIQTSDGALDAILNIGGNQYKVVVRAGSEGEVATPNANAVAKSSGAVKAGEVIAIPKNCEFYVDYSNITSDVIPKQPSDYYSHYEAEDGKVYIDFCIAYKNWTTKGISADDAMSAKLTYAGKYEYTGFSMIESDSRGDFTYSNITTIAPLTTEYLHYLFEVPIEAETSSQPLSVAFTIGGNAYTYEVR